MTPPAIDDELVRPNLLGSRLARYRTRAYRFTDDQRHYVLAERLEEIFLDGRQAHPATVEYVEDCLMSIRATGQVPRFDPAVAAAEGIDIDAELITRQPYCYTRALPGVEPEQVIVVLGAPRSGTSHLINLLAHTRRFAYLTTATCWAWPIRNLTDPARHLFTSLGKAPLQVDNKHTRTIPALVMPGEAEDIYARALPVYQHIAGHRYEIKTTQLANLNVLRAAVSAHLQFFNRKIFITKSPFNAFRIPLLDQLWGTETHYVHIIRDQHATADSIRRNHFEYIHNKTPLTAEGTWTLFVSAIERDAPTDRLVTVTHTELLHQPDLTVTRILKATGLLYCKPDTNSG